MRRFISLAIFSVVACSVAAGASSMSEKIGSDDDRLNISRDGSEYEVVSRAIEIVCPADMALVHGLYCTQVKQVCEVWKDKQYTDNARCQKYKPSECIGERIPLSFCMDFDEFSRDGETLPTVNITFYEAKKLCSEKGKRLCREDEFNFACEGEAMLPYTTGLERPYGICNIDIGRGKLGKVGHLTDWRQPSAGLIDCVSPFGVRNLNGNIGEVVVRNVSSGPYSCALKSGWWGPVRNRCRPATVVHSEAYSGSESGTRCCANPHNF